MSGERCERLLDFRGNPHVVLAPCRLKKLLIESRDFRLRARLRGELHQQAATVNHSTFMGDLTVATC